MSLLSRSSQPCFWTVKVSGVLLDLEAEDEKEEQKMSVEVDMLLPTD